MIYGTIVVVTWASLPFCILQKEPVQIRQEMTQPSLIAQTGLVPKMYKI